MPKGDFNKVASGLLSIEIMNTVAITHSGHIS